MTGGAPKRWDALDLWRAVLILAAIVSALVLLDGVALKTVVVAVLWITYALLAIGLAAALLAR